MVYLGTDIHPRAKQKFCLNVTKECFRLQWSNEKLNQWLKDNFQIDTLETLNEPKKAKDILKRLKSETV